MRALTAPARRPARRRESGAAAVEFALIAPLFCALLFGIIEYGWYFYQRFALVAAVRDGIRAGLPVTSTPVSPAKDAWTVAQERALVVLTVGGVIKNPSTSVTWGPSGSHYGSAVPTKSITLSASYTYVPLIGFTPMPSMPMNYSMTMLLELDN